MAMTINPEKKRHGLILLQNEHSEYLYGRENEILDKIELEEPLTPEERMFYLMRTLQQMQRTLEQIQTKERSKA